MARCKVITNADANGLLMNVRVKEENQDAAKEIRSHGGGAAGPEEVGGE